jgi:hypothetical protein
MYGSTQMGNNILFQLKLCLHWQIFLAKTSAILWRDYATLPMFAKLGDVTQIELILLVSCSSR